MAQELGSTQIFAASGLIREAMLCPLRESFY